MKKLLLLASITLLSLTHAATASGSSHSCHIGQGKKSTPVVADSVRAKMEIKQMDVKKADITPRTQKEIKIANPTKAETLDKKSLKPIDSKGEMLLKEEGFEPIDKKETNKAKSASIDEIKATAKSENRAKTPAKKEVMPAVSYPYYTGGNVAIREFVRKHLRYPQECKSERLRGRVEVTMTISWDGTPHSPKVTKSSGNEYMDAEALRIADMMPGWNPAPESESPQDIQYTIYVNFRPGR